MLLQQLPKECQLVARKPGDGSLDDIGRSQLAHPMAECLEELPQRHDPYASPGTERQHLLVSRHDDIRARGKRALEDPVVAKIAKHTDALRWDDVIGQRREEDSGPGKLFDVTSELAG